MEMPQATEFMDGDPAVAHPEMTLGEVVPLFSKERVRALPVTDSEGRLLGVVTESDLFLKDKGVPFSIERVPTLLGKPVLKEQLSGADLATQVTVGEIMTRRPVTVGPDVTLEEAAMLMHRRRISILPVVEGDRLVGVIRRIYLLRRIYGPRG
jgi:CBS domain-containing protein